MRPVYRKGGRSGGGGEADSDDAVITDGRYYYGGGKYMNGGDIPMGRTKEEAKFMRDMDRYDEGFQGMMNKELRRRDRDAFAAARQDPEGYYPALESETSVLLDMLNSGKLNSEDLIRLGKRRRGLKQAATLGSEVALGLFGAGKVAQSEAEKLTGNRPNFGRSLLMALGII
jgi:hypothetical protein